MSENLNAGWRSGKTESTEQAMRLMAAAPDMLEALLYIADRIRDEHLEDVANKAIDKAQGKQS